MSDHYDLVVVGSGPAGQAAALQAASLNKRVAIVERGREMGGVALHSGTIPSKVLREAATELTLHQRPGRSLDSRDEELMSSLLERVAKTINRETEVIAHRLRRSRVEVIQGTACFIDDHHLQVENRHGHLSTLSADYVLLAPGTRPVRPPGIPFDGEVIIDSDDILHMQRLPGSLLVVGAGVIGVEYASIFSALDCRVILVDERSQMIDFVDRELSAELESQLRGRGVEVRLGDGLRQLEKDEAGRVCARLESGREYRVEMVLYVAGREGCVDSLSLESAGLSSDAQGCLSVNRHYQTKQPHIYAAGDITGFPSLVSTSMEQGRLAVRHAFGQPQVPHPEWFPLGVYAIPEVSMVGRTEEQLSQEGIHYVTGHARYDETVRGSLMGLQGGMVKLLFGREDRRLLGVHIIGLEATELVHVGQAVLSLNGGLDYFLSAVFNHPTLAEAYKLAALDAAEQLGG